MWFFSRSKTFDETNIGKYAFSTPSFLISVLNQATERLVGSTKSGMRRRTLDLLPDAVRPGLEDVASRNAVVVEHVGFEEDLVSRA